MRAVLRVSTVTTPQFDTLIGEVLAANLSNFSYTCDLRVCVVELVGKEIEKAGSISVSEVDLAKSNGT